MSSLPLWFTTVFAAIIGACLGSFAGVLLERVPRRESTDGRSHCVCGRQLAGFENVPVVSWLALGGRARCCEARIPAWYLYLELAGASWCALGAVVAGLPGAGIAAVLFVTTTYLLAVRRRWINDTTTGDTTTGDTGTGGR